MSSPYPASCQRYGPDGRGVNRLALGSMNVNASLLLAQGLPQGPNQQAYLSGTRACGDHSA